MICKDCKFYTHVLHEWGHCKAPYIISNTDYWRAVDQIAQCHYKKDNNDLKEEDNEDL